MHLKPAFFKVNLSFEIPVTKDFQVDHDLCEDNFPELPTHGAEADLRRRLKVFNKSSTFESTYLGLNS